MAAINRFVRRHRRALAFALAFLGVLIGLSALRTRPQTRPLVVFGADLPAGHVIRATDVRVVHVGPEAVPAGAMTDAAGVEGGGLAGPVAAGEALTPTRVLGPGLLAGSPPGTVALPVRLDESADAAFVRQGDLVDVVAAPRAAGVDSAGGGGAAPAARTVARGVRVLAISGEDSANGPLLGGAASGAGTSSGSVLVVAADSATAATVAGLAGTTRLSVLLRDG